MKQNTKLSLLDYVTSKKNIYSAIYSIKSYIFEPYLLDKDNYKTYIKLQDFFDESTVKDVAEQCESRIRDVLEHEGFFEASVIFKIKKLGNNKKKQKPEFRPIHTAQLVDQIAMVALLQILVFNDTENRRDLSGLSKILPTNFYGNRASTNPKQLFKTWQNQYQTYSELCFAETLKAQKSSQYKHQINLDLRKFFPSIDPRYIFEYICEQFSFQYDDPKDFNTLEMIVYKLLHIKLKCPEDMYELYYGKNIPESTFCKGIAQGLPQGFFFGNIMMLLISQEADKTFPGKSFYYVDDSLILTNKKVEDFSSLRIVLERNINKRVDEYLESHIRRHSANIDFAIHDNIRDYHLQMHKDKSTCIEVSNIRSMQSLYFIARNTSCITHAIYNTLTENEDTVLTKKIQTFLSMITDEIRLVEESIEEDLYDSDSICLEDYLAVLQRYYKFFQFRERILLGRSQSEDTYIKTFWGQALKNKSPKSKALVNKLFDKDIFFANAGYLFELSKYEDYNLSNYVSNLLDWEYKKMQELFPIAKGSCDFLYLHKQQVTIESSRDLLKPDTYTSLSSKVKQNLPSYSKSSEEHIFSLVNSLVENPSHLLEKLRMDKEHYKFLFNTSNRFVRILFNAVVSHYFSMECYDNMMFVSRDNRSIKYNEIRILQWFRSSEFTLCDFRGYYKTNFLNEQIYKDSITIDYALLEVLPIFKEYIKNPIYIDHLIQTHRYVAGVWKNGSKMLHFFTLHNQEHAICLIKHACTLTRMIDYFKLKQYDYYILFAACYLHDISMAIHPNISDFLQYSEDSNQQINELIIKQNKEFNSTLDLKQLSDGDLRKILLEIYKFLDGYFENDQRSNHHTLSSKKIQEPGSELQFIDPAARVLIANVSEAHNSNAEEIYCSKSHAHKSLFSEKYLKIMLRLADLMDMSQERVSKSLLKVSIDNMPVESRFHWISHLVIDSCNVTSDYTFTGEETSYDNLSSVMNAKSIKESIQVNIKLNTLVQTPIDHRLDSKMTYKMTTSGDTVEIVFSNSDTKSPSNNMFMARWMDVKNLYLHNEMHTLEHYLQNNKNNSLDSKCFVKYTCIEDDMIPNEYIEMVKKRIQ